MFLRLLSHDVTPLGVGLPLLCVLARPSWVGVATLALCVGLYLFKKWLEHQDKKRDYLTEIMKVQEKQAGQLQRLMNKMGLG